MEPVAGCLMVGLVLAVIVLPIILSSIAFQVVSKLRRRVENLERFAELRGSRLDDQDERLRRLEGGRPAAAPPTPPAGAPPVPEPRERPVVIRPDLLAVPFPPPPPKILRPPEPAPAEAPVERVPLENLIGERILPRLGVVALVLGLALLVWYSYTNLGPKGRLALAGATGAVMVVGGVVLRRRAFTELLGGCLIGGGWAVLYITTYAARFVEASRIVDSPLHGFLLLLGVAGAALVHALRYRNETITGLAYLLIIVTLFVSPEPRPAAWLAMGLSGAILVILAWRERWIRLCTFGAVLLYIAEVAWLRRTPPAELVPAFAVLISLWLMWILPDYFHRPSSLVTKACHVALVLTNFTGLLLVGALMNLWFRIENMGAVWMALGALYAVHAVVGRRAAWRPAYLASLAFAAALLDLGAHEQFRGLGPAGVWIGVAAALFAWGLWRKDEIPRLLGVGAAVAALLRFWIIDRDLDYALAPALVLSALLYAQAILIAGLRKAGAAGETETVLAAPLAHVGAVALGLAIWHYPPDLAVALLLAVTGIVFLELAPRLGAAPLAAQGVVFLTAAVYFVASTNLEATGEVFGISSRLLSTVPVLAAWLYARETIRAPESAAEGLRTLFAILLFSGVLALLGFELGVSAAPVAWAVATGAWYLWSRVAERDLEFILAGLGAAGTVFLYAVTPTLSVPGLGWTGAVPSGVLILALLAAIHVASRRGFSSPLPSLARDVVAGAMATAGFVLLAREMTGTWLTGSWAVLGFALAGYGFLVRDRISRWSSLLVLAVCLGKVAIVDLAKYDMPVKIATLLTLGGVMVALSFVYARHHRRIVIYLAAKR